MDNEESLIRTLVLDHRRTLSDDDRSTRLYVVKSLIDAQFHPGHIYNRVVVAENQAPCSDLYHYMVSRCLENDTATLAADTGVRNCWIEFESCAPFKRDHGSDQYFEDFDDDFDYISLPYPWSSRLRSSGPDASDPTSSDRRRTRSLIVIKVPSDAQVYSSDPGSLWKCLLRDGEAGLESLRTAYRQAEQSTDSDRREVLPDHLRMMEKEYDGGEPEIRDRYSLTPPDLMSEYSGALAHQTTMASGIPIVFLGTDRTQLQGGCSSQGMRYLHEVVDGKHQRHVQIIQKLLDETAYPTNDLARCWRRQVPTARSQYIFFIKDAEGYAQFQASVDAGTPLSGFAFDGSKLPVGEQYPAYDCVAAQGRDESESVIGDDEEMELDPMDDLVQQMDNWRADISE